MTKSTNDKDDVKASLDLNHETLLETLLETQRSLAEERKAGFEQRKKTLRQKGFYAVQSSTDPTNACKILLETHTKKEEEKNQKWRELFKDYQADITRRIGALDAELEALKGQKGNAEQELEELRQKRKDLRAAIEQLKADALQLKQDFIATSKSPEQRFTDNVKAEIDQLAQLEGELYEAQTKRNQTIFNAKKAGITSFLDQLKNDRSFYEGRVLVISQKIRSLGVDDISPSVGNWLFYLGVGSAGVAGYFFSIFSVKAHLSSEDAFYYLLKNLISAAADSEVSLLHKFGYLFGAVTALTIVSWLVHLLLREVRNTEKRELADSQTNSIAVQYKRDGFTYASTVETKTWVSFWLRIVPPLLIAGIVIILLSLNKDYRTAADNLSASTEGLVIGTTIAMGLSAVIYLYIIKIIEPRLERIATKENEVWQAGPVAGDLTQVQQASYSRQPHPLRLNWELAVCLLLFLLGIIVFIFYRQGILPSSFLTQPEITISVVGFVTACLLAAFSLAYGIRYQGLIGALNRAATQLRELNYYIANNTDAPTPALSIDLQDNLRKLSAVHEASILRRAAVLGSGNSQKREAEWFPFASPGINRFDENKIFECSSQDAAFSPEYGGRLKALHTSFLEKNSQLRRVDEELKDHKQEQETELDEKKATIEELEKKREKWIVLKAQADYMMLLHHTKETERLEEENSFLEDGFHLGLWYQKRS